MYIQTKLKKDNKYIVSWIEKKKDIKVGCYVQLKETGQFWEVVELYSSMDNKDILDKQIKNKSFGSSIK